MKNIQVIDGANNCAYSIYQASDEAFSLIFPSVGQDIEFIEDFVERTGEKKASAILGALWKHRLAKQNVVGINGTLFFELGFKKKFYPNKQEADLDDSMIQGKAV